MASRPASTSAASSRRAGLDVADLGEEHGERRPPDAVGLRLPRRDEADHGRDLGESSLLAADAEHLDPVHRGGRLLGPPSDLVAAVRGRFGGVEPAVAQREERVVLLDGQREEGLPGALGQLAERGVLRAGLVDGEGLDEQRDAHAPGRRRTGGRGEACGPARRLR